MSEAYQVKIYLLGKLQEKSLTRSIVKVTQLKKTNFIEDQETIHT